MYALAWFFFSISLVASVAFPITYALTSRWWKNPIGRLMMGQGAIIALTYLRNLFHFIFDRTTIRADIPDLITSASFAVFLVTFLLVYIHVWRVESRRDGSTT